MLKGIKLYNFSEIDSYRQIHQPSLHQDRRISIEEHLDFKKLAERKANKRMKQGKHFVNFDQNPFDINQTHSKSAMNFRHLEPEGTKTPRNLVY